MDGNGRWAKKFGLPRVAGHKAGVKRIHNIIQLTIDYNIKYLTLYAFSTENWTRPEAEISALMDLLLVNLTSEVPELAEQGIRLVHYGSREKFSAEVLVALDKANAETGQGNKLTIGLALDYSGRSELLHAMQKIVDDGVAVSRENLEQRLYTAGVPDPDLLIRTAGEFRVSNFLLWQIAYSEIYVTEQCWPDFDAVSLDEAIENFAGRTRKFGSVR